jgi:hypothetical protein
MGMNTNDIRNMELNQWVYWAVALPLTIIIISICLALAGELQNFRSRFAKFWSGGKRGQPDYTAIPETYSMMEPHSILIRHQERERTRHLHKPLAHTITKIAVDTEVLTGTMFEIILQAVWTSASSQRCFEKLFNLSVV